MLPVDVLFPDWKLENFLFKVVINGKQCTAFLDTGASDTAIKAETCDRIGLKPQSQAYLGRVRVLGEAAAIPVKIGLASITFFGVTRHARVIIVSALGIDLEDVGWRFFWGEGILGNVKIEIDSDTGLIISVKANRVSA